MSIILYIIVSSIAVYFTAWLLPGISVESFGTAIITAIVLGVLNAVVKPLLQVLSLPITVVTLGLFLFVINTLIILLVGWIVPGFHVANFWWALLFSVILSIVMAILESVV
ncbi:phage holin family protein [Paludibacter sp. 221]|uniref:phage holin family protein n=1 Tax=Paludibacter sp. 221 TaxID=2302939 RepID=UPI0013D61877|nr:phage holin family protein [Paludibacter sp. 221]NDV45857.1 phage holin family protein [Paludibacter sp. 221]